MLVALLAQIAAAGASAIDAFTRHRLEALRARGPAPAEPAGGYPRHGAGAAAAAPAGAEAAAAPSATAAAAAVAAPAVAALLERLRLVAWLSSRLSRASAFLARGAGEAYGAMLRFALRAAAQVAAPWLEAARAEAARRGRVGAGGAGAGAGAGGGGAPLAAAATGLLARLAVLTASEAEALRLIGASLLLAYAAVYDAAEAAARGVFAAAARGAEAYLGER